MEETDRKRRWVIDFMSAMLSAALFFLALALVSG